MVILLSIAAIFSVIQTSIANPEGLEKLISNLVHEENSAKPAKFEGLANLISNLVSVDNSDLVFISDFKSFQQVCLF